MSPDTSKLPILLLTRPGSGNARVLAACEAAFGQSIPAVVSPVMEIVPVGDAPDLAQYASVILTSTHAVRGDLSGKSAYCVGARTASAAREAGARIAVQAPDAATLMAETLQVPPPAIYLRGAHVATDLTEHYGCDEQVVYDQRACPLSEGAKQLLEGEQPVILPLFSPRSARLIAKEVSVSRPNLRVIAMSPAVAAAYNEAGGGAVSVEICDAPTQVMMVSRIVASLRNT